MLSLWCLVTMFMCKGLGFSRCSWFCWEG